MNKNMKNKIRSIVLACATVGVLAAAGVGGFTAYLTDHAEATNTFTVGNIDITLKEDNYPGNDDASVKNLVPNQEISKDPKIENTGDNEAIVFASVSIPVKKLVLAADNGTRQNEAMTEIFKTKNQDGFGFGNVNSNWVKIDETYYDSAGAEISSVAADPIPDNAVKVVRTYGYTTKLENKNADADSKTTTAIFDAVKLVNVIENGITAGTDQNIEVKAYAIQSDNIANISTETLDSEKLEAIYKVYMKQQQTS